MSTVNKLIGSIADRMEASARQFDAALARVRGSYSKGDLVEDFTTGGTYAREILDPDGDVICHVIEDVNAERLTPGNTAADALITHLNR